MILLKNFIPALFVLFSIHSSFHIVCAQGRYGNELESHSIVSLTSKKGVLYNGIDNRLQLDHQLSSLMDTLMLCSDNGYIAKDSGANYLCIPQKTGILRLTLLKVADLDTSLIGYKVFVVENIPDPQLTINNHPITTPVTLSKKTLLNCDSLGVFFSQDIPGSDRWMNITEFSIGYNYGGFYVSHTNLTNKLTDKTKELINRLGPERELSIRTVVSSEGKVLKQLPIYRITIY